MIWQHWVFLSDEQLAEAGAVGASWQARAERRGFQNKRKLESDRARDLRRDVLAAQSELATKVFLGPWATWKDHGDRFKGKPDVEDFIDVKAILQRHRRLLISRDDRKPELAYVLVYCESPWFLVKGWQWGRDVTRLANLTNDGRPPHYLAEDSELRDPEELIDVAFVHHFGRPRAAREVEL